MNKSLLIIALGLGLGAGLFWPLDQDRSTPPAQETVVEPPAEMPEPAIVETEVNEAEPPAEPPTSPDPEPEPKTKAQPKPNPPAKPPAEPQAQPKPQTRVVKGQTPEEVISSFRRSPPLERKIVRPTQTRTVKKQPAAAPSPRPNIKTPRPKAKNPAAEPVNGNYCYLAYGYDDWPADVAFAVCMGESSGKPTAVNRHDRHEGCNGSYGLFQIACFWANPNDMLDPHQNVKKAHWLYKRSGWQPWGAYTNGSYRRYLP